MSLLVSVAIRQTGADSVNDGLRAGDVSDATRTALRAEMANDDIGEAYLRAMRTERVVAIRMALEQIGDPAQFGQDRISTSSRTVFGRLVHKVVARLAVRQVHGITAQLREHAIWVHTAIENLTEIIESIDEVERSTINRRLASIVERLTILEEDRRRSDDLAARQ